MAGTPNQFSPASAVDCVNPTLSDTADDPAGISRGIFFAATGNVAYVSLGGHTVTLTAVPANTRFPHAVRRVKSTGTTIANTDIYLEM